MQRDDADFLDFRKFMCYAPVQSRLTVNRVQWLVKPDELIYLGLHFAISKREWCHFRLNSLTEAIRAVYANSFLAS